MSPSWKASPTTLPSPTSPGSKPFKWRGTKSSRTRRDNSHLPTNAPPRVKTVSAPFLAKVTLTAIAAGQGLAPLFIDLNRTHATRPQWTGHARFHVVWQTFTATLSAAVTLALIWWSGHAENQRFYL